MIVFEAQDALLAIEEPTKALGKARACKEGKSVSEIGIHEIDGNDVILGA